MMLNDLVGKVVPERNDKILREADAFYDIGQHAMQQFIKANKNGDEAGKMHAITSIVNMAFSCELYLKCLFSDIKRGHKLDQLFDDTDENIQKLIVMTCINNHVATSETHFKNRLESISDAFADWRYYYEDDKNRMTIDYEFLHVFATCLKNLDVLYK